MPRTLSGRGGSRRNAGRKARSPDDKIHKLRVAAQTHETLKQIQLQIKKQTKRKPSMIDLLASLIDKIPSIAQLIASSPPTGEPSAWVYLRNDDYEKLVQLAKMLAVESGKYTSLGEALSALILVEQRSHELPEMPSSANVPQVSTVPDDLL